MEKTDQKNQELNCDLKKNCNLSIAHGKRSSVHIIECCGSIDVDWYLEGTLRTYTFYDVKIVDVVVFKGDISVGNAFYHMGKPTMNSRRFGVKYFKKFVLISAEMDIEDPTNLVVKLEEI